MLLELFILLVFLGGIAAGFIGSLTGLGGGVIIIPLLTLALGVDMHYAIGASLISVIATSTGAAAAFKKEGFANIRIGIFLVVASTIGAVIGAMSASFIPISYITILFALLLVYSAINTFIKKEQAVLVEVKDQRSVTFNLNSSYPTQNGEFQNYTVNHVVPGFAMMIFAGIMSGLLGIGSGALKVLAMDKIMSIPFKVSTTTSNFMIGLTGAASAVVYFQNGYIKAPIAGPVMIGVLLGATLGARLLPKLDTRLLRKIFAFVILFIAIQMMIKGIKS